MKTPSMNKYQELALGKHLSVGGAGNNGLLLNAMQNGFYANFQGCTLVENVTATPGPTFVRLSVDGDLDPYYVYGVNQLMTLRASSATACAAGFPNAAAVGDTGVLRLTTVDANAAGAVAMLQENALWMAPANDFSVVFDIAQWTQRNNVVGVAFSQFGIIGTCTVTDLQDSAKVPAWVDGTNDNASCYITLTGNRGTLTVVSANLELRQNSASFEIPAGAFTARIAYGAGATGGSPTVSVFINDRAVATIKTVLTGPFQLFARACNGANYLQATHTPAILDIDTIAVSMV